MPPNQSEAKAGLDIISWVKMAVNALHRGCGVDGATNCAGGNSDPVMYGFAGRAFNFIGEPGNIYNIISTLNIQVRPE